MKLSRYNLIRWAFLIPIYWFMMSCAAFMALFQLIFKPHYWEKTKHGLHLSTAKSSSSHKAVETTIELIEEKEMLRAAASQRAGHALSTSDSFFNGATLAVDIGKRSRCHCRRYHKRVLELYLRTCPGHCIRAVA